MIRTGLGMTPNHWELLEQCSHYDSIIGYHLTGEYRFTKLDKGPDTLQKWVDHWSKPESYQPQAVQPNEVDPILIGNLADWGLLCNVSCHWNLQMFCLTSQGKIALETRRLGERSTA